MKRKTTLSILIAMVLLVVTSFVVYAAFTVEEPFAGDVGYHEITDSIISSPTEKVSVSFTQVGQQVSNSYTLTNNDTKDYAYDYIITTNEVITDESEIAKWYQMVYVYCNDEYVGLLSSLISSQTSFGESYVFNKNSKTDKITFELHNSSNELVKDLMNSTSEGTVTSTPINFSITCQLKTTNVQKYYFATAVNIANIMTDITRSSDAVLVITEDLITIPTTTLQNNTSIDLFGHTVTLGGPLTVEKELEVYDSVGGGSIEGSDTANIVLNTTNSFLNPKVDITNVAVNQFNQTRLVEEATKILENLNPVAGSTVDLIGYLDIYLSDSFYLSLIVDEDDVSTKLTGATYTVPTDLSTNHLIGVSINYNNGSNVTTTPIDVKIIGQNEAIIETIVNENLKHLNSFKSSTNTVQVSYDLFLPTAIREYNATISWETTKEEVITHDGHVVAAQGNAMLTAYIKLYDEVYTVRYYINVLKENNLSKLQYLAGKIEQMITLRTVHRHSTPETEQKDYAYFMLPTADDPNSEYYYTNITGGTVLDILELDYEVESAYYYISVDETTTSADGEHLIDGKILTAAELYLNQITYEKNARIKIRGKFANEVCETFINIKIEISASNLADKVFDDLQAYLDTVDVLQYMLDTRHKYGVVNESGNFNIPRKYDVVDLVYSVYDTELFEVAPITGNLKEYEIKFKDYKKFNLSDTLVPIEANIVTLDSDGNPVKDEDGNVIVTAHRTLYFKIPGVVSTTNFPVIDFDTANKKNIFYTIKLQTLLQSNPDMVYNDKKDLSDASVTEIFALDSYILMHDIEKTEQLVFEYGNVDANGYTQAVVDKYDIKEFIELIEWATKADGTLDANPILSTYTGILTWVKDDGKATLSDEEIAVIKEYAEKYSGFAGVWDKYVNVLDNVLSNEDQLALKEIISKDKLFIEIMNWLSGDKKSMLITYILDMSDSDLSPPPRRRGSRPS